MANDLMAATTAIPSKFIEGLLASSETTQYTVSSSPAKSAEITFMRLTNTTASAVTVSVSVVTSGGTVGAANRILIDQSIGPKATFVFDISRGLWLGAGDFISTIASAAASVSMVARGILYS